MASLEFVFSFSIQLKSSSESFDAVKAHAAESQAFTNGSRRMVELPTERAAVPFGHPTPRTGKKLDDELCSTLHSQELIAMVQDVAMALPPMPRGDC